MEERRAHPRLPLPLHAAVVVGGKKHLATIEDLSAGGAGLLLTEKIPAGTDLDKLSFVLPAAEDVEECEIASRAHLIYSEPIEQEGGEGGHRAGIRFLDLPEDRHRRIQQFIYRTLTKGRPGAGEMPLERRRVALEQPVSIRFDRFDEFVGEVSQNISASGMFIRAIDPKPPGTEFTFEFQLGDDFSLVEGRAEVVWTRKKSLDANRPAGMGVRFLRLDERSRNVILSLVQKAAEREGTVPAGAPALPKTISPAGAAVKKTGDRSDVEPTGKVAGGAAAVAEVEDKTLRRELARRTKAYEGRIAELEGQIQNLAASRVDEESHRLQSESSTSQLQEANTLLETRLSETRAHNAQEVRELREQLEVAEQSLKELRDEARSHEAEIKEKRRKASGLENRLLAVEQALKHAEASRDEVSARLKAGVDTRHELEARIESLESDENASKLKEVTFQLDETVNRIAVLDDRLAVAGKERDEALEKLSQSSSSTESLHRVIEDVEREREKLRVELGDAKGELARAQKDREIELAEAESRAEQAESSKKALEDQLDQLREELETSEAERADAGSRGAETVKQVEQLEAALENALRAQHEVEESLRRVEDEVERSARDHEDLENGLRQEALKAVAAADGARSSVEHLETSLAETERERLKLQEELEAGRRELEKSAGAAEELESRIASLEDSLAEAETSGQDLTNQIEGLKSRSRKAEEDATASKSELDQLRTETEARISDLEGSLAESEKVERAQAEEIAHLEALVTEAERERQELEERLSADVDETRAEAANLSTELTRFVAAEETARSELDALREESENRIANLEGRLTEAEEVGGEQGKKMSHLEALLADTEREAKELEETLRFDLEEEKSEVATLRSELERAQTAEASVKEDLEQVQKVAETLQSDLERAQEELRDTAKQAREAEGQLREEVENSTTSARVLEEKLAELEDSVRVEGERNASLVADLEQTGTEREELKDQVVTLHAAVRGLRAELEDRGFGSEAQAAVAMALPDEPRSSGGWLRAAGLLVAGLLVGALLMGPGARFLSIDPGGWFGGDSAVDSAAGSEPRDTAEAGSSSTGEDLDLEAGEKLVGDPSVAASQSPEDVASAEPAYPAVTDVVNAWAGAWSDQRVDDYLWFYSNGFAPPNGASRAAWEAYRRERVEAPAAIDVTVTDLTEESLGEDRTKVTFEQGYTAGSYSDRVRKTLVMVREDGSWKILSEESEAL